MRSMKWVVLVLALLMVAGLVIGCGNRTPPANDEPEAVPGPAITHAIDGAYATCANCHGTEIADSHADFADYEARCLDCHEGA